MPKIRKITCHKTLNSRGDWTIDTRVVLNNGAFGEQTIPSGASTGENEAKYISVDKAIDVVSSVLNDSLKGESVYDQEKIDNMMIELDGTSNKHHLGGNSILSVSLATSKAAAVSKGIPLYKYLAGLYGSTKIQFPTPLFNVLNGGLHAHNNLSFQEFLCIPARKYSFDKAYEIGVDVYKSLKNTLDKAGYDIDVGDEGGFAPNGLTVRKALELVKKSASKNYEVGVDVFFGMDVAADSFRKGDKYEIKEEQLTLSGVELQGYYSKLVNDFEIIYMEDPFYEGDLRFWAEFNEKMSDSLLVVGDDLVVTNPKYLTKAIENRLINAVIVKPNQVGTLTEVFGFVKEAKEANMTIIVSHRSGDTAEDTFIADLSLAICADFIKSGAPARGERVVKYNRLLDIYDSLV